MTSWSFTRTVQATPQTIFGVVSDPLRMSEAVPCSQSVEFLSEQQSGVGTRFRETRDMNGKPQVNDLEITELVDDERVRMVTDSHGAVWDSTFLIRPEGDQSSLTITMDARPHKLMPKIMIPIFKGMIGKGLEKDLASISAFCEQCSPDAR